jgi:hypothetical protein
MAHAGALDREGPMSTVLEQRTRLRLTPDRIFFGSMALAMLATVFVGFSPTYYLMRWTDAPALAPLVHLHGIAFSLWFVGFFVQTALISARRADLHKALGAGMIALAVAMVILGLNIAIGGDRAGTPRPFMDGRAFLLLPLTILALFVTYLTLGYRYRRRSDYHKRLMLLASLVMLVPAIARWRVPGLPGPVVGMIVTSFFLFVAWGYDWRRLGRIHPALLWGGLLLLASMPFRWLFGRTQAWQNFAAFLLA